MTISLFFILSVSLVIALLQTFAMLVIAYNTYKLNHKLNDSRGTSPLTDFINYIND